VSERRSILLLCDNSRSQAGNVLQHIQALRTLSRHRVYSLNPVDRPDSAGLLDLEEFDVVVIHYTIMVTGARYLAPVLAENIAGFRGLKVQLIQDEYRSVDAVSSKIRELGIDVLYTCVPAPEKEEIYTTRLPGVQLVTTLPGFVADELVGRDVPPLERRRIDVGYRGRDVPYWLGRLGREKSEIGRGFLEHAKGNELRCDISSKESDRIYGEKWNRFLANCRATLGTESGASVIDFDGSIQRRVGDYLARDPGASFEDVADAVLGDRDGALAIHVASPRLFEAAALRTAMVLFTGGYSGVVEPWTHYVPLEKDFSNIDAVVEALRDLSFLETLTARARADLIESGTYSLRTFVSEFDELIEERSTAAGIRKKPAFRRARLRRRLPSWRTRSNLRTTTGKVLIPMAGLLLVLQDSTLRRLAASGGRRRAVRRAGIFSDLVRLAALRNGVRGGSFEVDSEPDSRSGLLYLRSVAPCHGSEPANSRVTESRPEVGRPAEIVWNHSRVGVSASLTGGQFLAVHIGHHGVEGAYSFTALAELARVEPRLVLDAFGPVLHKTGGRPRSAVEVKA
jgi:hypothetical protein